MAKAALTDAWDGGESFGHCSEAVWAKLPGVGRVGPWGLWRGQVVVQGLFFL